MPSVIIFDRVLDNGLSVLDTEATHLYICSAQPTTFTEATVTLALGNKNFGAGAVFGSTQAAAPDGRKVSTSAFDDGTITATGTPAAFAITDNTNSRLLLAGDINATQNVTAGQRFALTSLTVHIPSTPSGGGQTGGTTLWDLTNLIVQPRISLDVENAVWSGSSLSSITAGGSDGGAMSVNGTPTKGTASNGYDPIRVGSTGQFLSRTLAAWSSGKLSIFWFGHLNTIAINGLVNFNWNSSNVSGPGGVFYPAISGAFLLGIFNRTAGVDSAPYYSTSQTGNVVDTVNNHSLYTQAGATDSVILDGIAVALASSGSFPNTPGAVPNYQSGAWQFLQGFDGEGFDGDSFSLLIFDDVLGTTELQKLEGWAWWKFTGGGAGLPSDHPYKNMPPTA
jgi:hypothetical protein